MHFNVYDVSHTQNYDQHVSAAINAILRVMLLLQYKGTNEVCWVAVTTCVDSVVYQYTTPSTHHLQLVPTSIPHRLHITYSLFQLL